MKKSADSNPGCFDSHENIFFRLTFQLKTFDYWKLLQNFSCLPDWPFPVEKCWFQWNSFPKEKSFWKVSIQPLCQYMNPNMFKIPAPVWKRGERMCVGDREWTQKTQCSPGKVVPALTCSSCAAVEVERSTKSEPVPAPQCAQSLCTQQMGWRGWGYC